MSEVFPSADVARAPAATSSYADAAASQPRVLPEALAALHAALALGPLNPSSVHREGQRAKKLLRDARERVAARFGASPEEVVFTSGATEGLTWALRGLTMMLAARPLIAVAAGEHKAVAALLDELAVPRVIMPCAEAGLLCVHAVQHHTGVLTDLAPWLAMAQQQRTPLIIDASQAALDVDHYWKHQQVTALALSGHKLGAPSGIGVLLLRAGVPFVPSLHGGPQQHELRAGTEAVALIAALAATVDHVYERRTTLKRQLTLVTQAFEAELTEIRGLRLYGQQAERAPGISAVGIVGVAARKLIDELSQLGIAASSGAACAALGSEPNGGALALGLSRERAQEMFRVSFAFDSSIADATSVARAVTAVAQRLRSGGLE